MRLTCSGGLVAFDCQVSRLRARVRSVIRESRDFLGERSVGGERWERSRLYRFAHFWLMTGKSFARNRCPVRAAALAYTTLLALIPVLAVALSISTSLLKKQGEQRVLQMVDRFVDSVVPPATVKAGNGGAGFTVDTEQPHHFRETNTPPTQGTKETNTAGARTDQETSTNSLSGATNNSAMGGGEEDVRKEVARSINRFIQNTSSSTLGVTGTVLLMLVVINMLSRIEETFNDIWGVTRGRNWFARLVQYSAVLVWGPVLLVCAVGLAGGPRLEATRQFLEAMPFLGTLLFELLPVVVLCLAFGFLYLVMPNTKVHWQAALVGGLVAGVLWHLNGKFSVFYVSRWISNSRIYGSLAVIPVFMVGLYFAWMILLFGAQVAYAHQNRTVYLQEKQAENINQRGREFIALRLMTCVGQRFQRGEPPLTIPEMATQLAVPSRLAQQLLQVLVAAQLVVEVSGKETAYAPARPLERITCHDILLALRAGQGQELVTTDEPARAEVYGEFRRILEAERRAAAAITVSMMVDRADALAAGPETKAVTDTPNSPDAKT